MECRSRSWALLLFGFHIHPPTYKFLAKYEYIQRGSEYLSRITICYYSVRIQWIVKPNLPQNLWWRLWNQQNFCFIWNKNQCQITSCHFSWKFKYPFDPSLNFWVISDRSQSMGLILGQKLVKSRLGCSVWPKSSSLSKYFLGYGHIDLFPVWKGQRNLQLHSLL